MSSGVAVVIVNWNSGELALAEGAKRIVGFDVDHGAREIACARAQAEGLDFLPLAVDVADPSPGQGFQSRDRPNLEERLA